jgi:hypothetical protein
MDQGNQEPMVGNHFFTVSSPFFSVIVCPALLQSHRNPIQAAAPFLVEKTGAAQGEQS